MKIWKRNAIIASVLLLRFFLLRPARYQHQRNAEQEYKQRNPVFPDQLRRLSTQL